MQRVQTALRPDKKPASDNVQILQGPSMLFDTSVNTSAQSSALLLAAKPIPPQADLAFTNNPSVLSLHGRPHPGQSSSELTTSEREQGRPAILGRTALPLTAFSTLRVSGCLRMTVDEVDACSLRWVRLNVRRGPSRNTSFIP